MVLNGLTLENADEGIRMYLKGYVNNVAPDWGGKLQDAGMWADACG